MRALLISLAATLLTAAPAWAATAGAYAASEAADADACARRCADDGLCMMWVYSAHVCELRASVGANLQAEAAGLSPNAPPFARSAAWAATPPKSPPPAPPQRAMALLGGPETDRSGLRLRLGDTP
jgi:hypothetical protein